MIRVSACSHYLQAIQVGEALPNLDERLRPLLRDPIRRIDRFIQLALLGSLSCAQSRTLESHAGLYVGSGTGPVGNNIVVQETLIKDHLLPKPFHFVNTLGSSTGYYICKNLQLDGPSLFISRRSGSFLATLACAMADLQLGVVKQALLGIVEECALPLAQHLQRLNLPPNTPLAEGSHWMLLETDTAVPGREIQVTHFDTFSSLKHSLESTFQAKDFLVHAQDTPPGTAKELSVFRHYSSEAAFHDSRDAAILTEFTTSENSGRLFFAEGNETLGWNLIELGEKDSSPGAKQRP